MDVLSQFEVNCQLYSGGVGTANSELVYLLGLNIQKAVLLSIAREQGARGGTILGARGATREQEAAFFGIAIHPEKEILMLVVEKHVRNKILNALYTQMGMDKKAQGIVFSLPVSDVAGLAPLSETKE